VLPLSVVAGFNYPQNSVAGTAFVVAQGHIKFVQYAGSTGTAWTPWPSRSHHSRVRVLAHIKKLDDCFGQFLVRVSCPCGASRHIEPEALARLVGWSTTLKALAPRLRCSQCGKKAAEVVAVARPRPRGAEEPALTRHAI
jgi:hypothetical protein